ncbi:MAG: hypothetical protein AAF513_05825 [Pseudomonadota bacterium]
MIDPSADEQSMDDEDLNTSLRDVVALMLRELERLKLELQNLQLLERAEDDPQIRDLRERIATREMRLQELRAMLDLRGDDDFP